MADRILTWEDDRDHMQAFFNQAGEIKADARFIQRRIVDSTGKEGSVSVKELRASFLKLRTTLEAVEARLVGFDYDG